MKLAEIKSMFAVGDVVSVTREGSKPLTVIGNTGTTTLGAKDGTERRTIKACRSGDWIMTKPDGRDIYTTHPKASEVIAAYPDCLQFRYNNGVIITIKKEA